MKKISFQMIIALVLMAFSGFSQSPTIGLTFTAKYNSQYVMLDSIYIQNLTQPGDTMLFMPDTVLYLDYVSGIHDYGGTAKTSFSVSPNYPNPSVDGKTAINVFIPKREIVTMRVFDILGNEVAFYENALDAGNHHFNFLAGNARYYVLSVNCGNEIRSVKMINSGNSNQMQGTLIYQGMTEADHSIKSQETIAGFDYSLGDNLRFVGYSKNPSGMIGSDVIEATPQGNEDLIFEIIEGLPCPGIPTVTYEGQTYKTVQIGNQCWFKENLNLGTIIEGTENQANNSVFEKYCYDDDPSNCAVYGGLYQWDEMMQYDNTPGAKGICPNDWHLPTDAEWTFLINYLGGESVAGGKMKSTGTIEEENGLWSSPNYGATNSGGFSGLPGGFSESAGNFLNLGNSGLWWSSTELSATNAWHRYLTYGDTYAFSYNYDKNYGFSVRCLKNETSANIPTVTTFVITGITQTTATGGGEVTADGGAEVTARGVCWSTSQNPTIADCHTSDGTGTGAYVSNLNGLTPNTSYFVRAYANNSVGTAYGEEVTFTTLSAIFNCGGVVGYEGTEYKTIQIGTQCWFKENLNVGTMIDGVQNQANNSVIEKYCYENQESNCSVYGGLYQWDEMMQYANAEGVQGICPAGWHLPTDAEVTTLTTFVSCQAANCCTNNADYIAKSLAATTNWNPSTTTCAIGNILATNNATGFTGLSGGYRNTDGSFLGFGSYGYFWSSTQVSSIDAWSRGLHHFNAYVHLYYGPKDYGFSVRCVRD